MRYLVCLLLLSFFLTITPAHAQDEPCQDIKVRINKHTEPIIVANTHPCVVLLKMKASNRRMLYRIRPKKDSVAEATPYPPKTSCRWWQYWGGVTVIAVDKHTDCTVYLRSLQKASYTMRVKRMERPKSR